MLIVFNKPFRVMSQFSPSGNKKTLADYIQIPKIYPAGRLDFDSEGLLLLTDDGQLQHRISDPKHKQVKTYWAQVEGVPDAAALQKLRDGIQLKDEMTRPAEAELINEPNGLWLRDPPIRHRADIPTCWLALSLTEGRNRQVRRMTAAVGYPTLRLIRATIGQWSVIDMAVGTYCQVD